MLVNCWSEFLKARPPFLIQIEIANAFKARLTQAVWKAFREQ
jgi:hypothetical protein